MRTGFGLLAAMAPLASDLRSSSARSANAKANARTICQWPLPHNSVSPSSHCSQCRSARFHHVRPLRESFLHRSRLHRQRQTTCLLLPGAAHTQTALCSHPHRFPRRHSRFHPSKGGHQFLLTFDYMFNKFYFIFSIRLLLI